MTRQEFEVEAREFADMYVSDYATGDVRVEVDDCEPGDEPEGCIAFRTCFDDEEWSVPICVGGKNRDELEVSIPDSEGYDLNPQNFYVYLWNEAAKRARNASDDLATHQQAEEFNREKLAKALGLDPFDPLTGQLVTPSMLMLVATAKTQSLRLVEAAHKRMLKRLAEALYDLASGESVVEFDEQTDDVKDAYRKAALEETK